MLKKLDYFTNFEKILWFSSVALITTFFFLFSQSGILSLVASLVGTTALIFCAKGNPIGQGMMIIFSIIYGIISYSFEYYGEGVLEITEGGKVRKITFDGEKYVQTQMEVSRKNCRNNSCSLSLHPLLAQYLRSAVKASFCHSTYSYRSRNRLCRKYTYELLRAALFPEFN